MTERAGLTVLLDQNVPGPVTAWLREERPHWRVSHVNCVGLAGKPDRDVFTWAQKNGAIIITYDEDFADPRSYPWGSHHGVVRLRVWPTTIERTEEALARLLSAATDDDLRRAVVIVGNRRIRIRPAPKR